jgi:hypothetical protein
MEAVKEERADRQLQERWHRLSPKGDPRRVKVHDFEDKELGKVVPYGVYDVGANAGWVSVGVTSDTAQFAVASIRRWLDAMGRERYPKARELTITADGGGSNGTRVRLWKVELQKLADETGLVLHVHHYPPGTSKWRCPAFSVLQRVITTAETWSDPRGSREPGEAKCAGP